MFEFIASLLRSIVLAPWLILRPLLRGSSPSTLPPSARAKARIQAQKANAKPQPQAPSQQQRPAKVKKARMEPASASASVEDRPKLAEQAPAKGEISYTYWAGKGGGDVPLPEPRKLTDEENAELQRQTAASAASAWNAAGTFEERGASGWAKGRLTDMVRGMELPGGDVTVLDVNSCEGEANIFIVRGKKRCGFDFEMQLAWKATPRPGAIEIRGHCKVLNFSSDDPDDLDVQPEVAHRQPERAADEAAALARVRAVLKAELAKVLPRLLEELKQK